MEILSIQFYSCMRREFKANKNLWTFVFLLSPLILLFISAALALISDPSASPLLRISLVTSSFYLSGKLIQVGLGFIAQTENFAWLRHVGLSEFSINYSIGKLVLVFLSPITLTILLGFWFTLWGDKNEYSLAIYTSYFILYLGWISVNIWKNSFSLIYFVSSIGAYALISGMSPVLSVGFLLCAAILLLFRYFELLEHSSISSVYLSYSAKLLLIRPLVKRYLQNAGVLVAYIVYLRVGDLSNNEGLFLLIIILNVMITQLRDVALLNNEYAVYCDFLVAKKNILWHANKWKFALFLNAAVVTEFLLSNRSWLFLLTMLVLAFLCTTVAFYLTKRDNPYCYIYVNAVAIGTTLVSIAYLDLL